MTLRQLPSETRTATATWTSLPEIMQEGVETTVTSVPVGAYMEKMLFKFAVVNGADESSLHVFWAEPEMAASGPRVDLDFNEVFLGSDPAAANQAHGLYALAMTFDQALDAEQIGRQITLALGGQPAPPASVPGDLDQNGVVNLSDFATFACCYLGSGVPAVPGCALADLDGDGDVDLADFATFAVNYGS